MFADTDGKIRRMRQVCPTMTEEESQKFGEYMEFFSSDAEQQCVLNLILWARDKGTFQEAIECLNTTKQVVENYEQSSEGFRHPDALLPWRQSTLDEACVEQVKKWGVQPQ